MLRMYLYEHLSAPSTAGELPWHCGGARNMPTEVALLDG